MSAQRLEDLEVRIAFLEKNITDLDEVVRSLSDNLDQMRRELTTLRETVQVDTLTVSGDPRDERPPHY